MFQKILLNFLIKVGCFSRVVVMSSIKCVFFLFVKEVLLM